jgi:hypothetical protein
MHTSSYTHTDAVLLQHHNLTTVGVPLTPYALTFKHVSQVAGGLPRPKDAVWVCGLLRLEGLKQHLAARPLGDGLVAAVRRLRVIVPAAEQRNE